MNDTDLQQTFQVEPKNEVINLSFQNVNVLAHQKVIEERDDGKILHNLTIKTAKDKGEFIKLFVDNIDIFGIDLTEIERKIFLSAAKECNYRNVVRINSDFRKGIEVNYGVKKAYISTTLSKLIEKNFLIKLNPKLMSPQEKKFLNLNDFDTKAYLLNPYVVGKGSFHDLLYVRQIVTKEFDFKNFRFIKKYDNQFEYDGLDKLLENSDNYNVVKMIQENESGGMDVDLILEPKNVEHKEKAVEAEVVEIEKPKEQVSLKAIQLQNKIEKYSKNLEETKNNEIDLNETLIKTKEYIQKKKEEQKKEILQLETQLKNIVDLLGVELVKQGKVEEYAELCKEIATLSSEF